MTEHMAVNPPRSIVTDHYLLDLLVLRSRRGLAVSWTPIGPANNKLKAQGRTNLANGISLDVTDDLQG